MASQETTFAGRSDLGTIISDPCTEAAVLRHFHERKSFEPMAPATHTIHVLVDASHLRTVQRFLDFHHVFSYQGKEKFYPRKAGIRTEKYTRWCKPHREVSLLTLPMSSPCDQSTPSRPAPSSLTSLPEGHIIITLSLVPPSPSGTLKWHAAFQMAPDEARCVISLNLHRAFLNLINQLVTITLNCSVPITLHNFQVFAPNLYNKTICPVDNLSTKVHYCCSATVFIRCGKKSVWVLHYVKDQFHAVALDLMWHLQFKVVWYLSMVHFTIFLFHFFFLCDDRRMYKDKRFRTKN